MAEFAAAILDLSTFAFHSAQLISEFAQGVRGQNARLNELAAKIERLSWVLQNAHLVQNDLKTSNDPYERLQISLKLLETAIDKCERGIRQVTKYSGQLNVTLQKSMFDRVFHEWRHEFSGKAALEKALKDIDDRERDITSAINSATYHLTRRLDESLNPVGPPPYPRATSTGSSVREAPAPPTSEPVEAMLSPSLIRAIEKNDKSSVRELIRGGTQILRKDREGCCALHLAIRAGDKDVLRELLKSNELQTNPESVNTRDRQGATALHYAAKVKTAKLAIKLLEAGADIGAINKHKRSVLSVALEANNHELVEKLLARGAEKDSNLRSELVQRLKDIKSAIVSRQPQKERTTRKR